METWLAARLLVLIPLLLSLSVHEWAHAYVAWLLGDDTAKAQGRMTMDPLAHMDPVGTLILPLLGVPIGWAKPVPVNPARFVLDIDSTAGMILVAAAGPVSNLMLAGVVAVLHALVPTSGVLSQAARMFVGLNIALAAFNLLPIPPLDGSRVVDGLVPDALRPAWDLVGRAGPVLIPVALVLGGIVYPALLLAPTRIADWVLGG